jgi:hypothetical protein
VISDAPSVWQPQSPNTKAAVVAIKAKNLEPQ